MILVDTSVWIDHLHSTNEALQALLDKEAVSTHPFVIGEVACGGLRRRKEILDDLAFLPVATAATHEEVLAFLEQHRLWGRGIGWIDLHLLASAMLSHDRLWTLDQSLKMAAVSLDIHA